MNLILSIQFAVALVLFSYANAGPVDSPQGLIKFDEIADMNKILKNAVEIDNPTLTHHDEDEAVIPIKLNTVPNLKYDVELLESEDLRKDSDEVEERFRGAALHLDTNLFTDEDIEVHKLNDPRSVSYLALISVCTAFGLVALIVYAALIIWRQKLEQRYGQRVLLVTHCDDDIDYMHQMHNGGSNSRPYPLTTV